MDFAEDITYGVLDCGMRLVCRQVKSEVAYVGFMMNTGSRDDRAGLAHFVEHTLFKGTRTRSALQLIDEMENVGGEMNAYTTKEETVLYTTVLNPYVPLALELMQDMLLNSTFPEEELRKERDVILDEIDSYLDTPSEQIYDDFERDLFRGSSVGTPILGSKDQVRALNGQDAKDYVRNRYNVDEMVMFIQSPESLDSLKLKVDSLKQSSGFDSLKFNGLKKRTWSREVPAEVKRRQVTEIRTDHQTHVMLGGRAYPLGHERRLGMYLLNNILGGPGLNSRLNLALREQEGLVYDVESTYQAMTDCGYWSVYFGCDAEDRDRCMDLVEQELRQLKERELSSLELMRYKQQLRGQLAIGAESPESVALSMAKSHLHFDRVRDWKQTMAEFEKVSARELWDIANECY